MKLIPIVPRLAAAAAVLLGAAAAFALPAGADVSVLSPPVAAVQIGSPATLGAHGASVTVPVTTVCASGTGFTHLFVQISQKSGGGIASGNAMVEDFPCTGTFNTLNVVVLANNEQFRHGDAAVEAELFLCSTECASSTDQREIRVVN